MRKSLDSSPSKSHQHLHMVQPRLATQVQTSANADHLSSERKRIVERLVAVVFAMKPEARENILRLAEIMAEQQPAAPRMYLVHAGLSAKDADKTGSTR